MNRRTILSGTAIASTSLLVAGAAGMVASQAMPAVRAADPFVARFQVFRDELASYNAEPEAWPAERMEPWNTLCAEIDGGHLIIGSAAGALMAMERIRDLDCILDGEAETYLAAVIAFLKAEA